MVPVIAFESGAPAMLGWAALCGLLFGFGLWSLVSLVPVLNRPRLLYRVAPYLVDISPGARELLSRKPVNPLPVIGTIAGPPLARVREVFSSSLGGTATLQRRLRQSNSRLTPESFRARQLTWALGGGIVGVVGSGVVVVVSVESVSLALQVAVVLFGAVSAVVLRDYLLQRAARARLLRMMSELPTVLEFLTLSLSAGEGVLDSIRRVSRISRGDLAGELAATVAAVNTGLPFGESLSALAADLELPALSRAVEQIVGALERGTPLAEVLRAQAQDARDDAKRSLLESAGKKEVAMLIPLVFLILPLTVIFAIYPGIFVLQLGF